MKKLIIVALSALLLAACSDDKQDTSNTVKKDKVESNEPSQAELDAKLKKEATQADFVEMNGETTEKNTKVFAEGNIDVVITDGTIGEFTLSTKEDGGIGMYTVKSFIPDAKFTKGDKVKVYGTYGGKDDTGMPIINTTILEHK